MEFANYEKINRPYQMALNKIHGKGVVIVLEAYINPNASILHYCMDCKSQFYNAPKYELKEDRKHVCNTRYPSQSGDRPKIKEKKGLTAEETVQIIELGKQGKSVPEVARMFGVRPSMIRYRFKKNGII